MKKLLFLALVCIGNLQADDTTFSMPVNTAKTAVEKMIRIKIDISESDISAYNLQKSAIYNEIATRLSLGAIQIKDDSTAPELVLRIKAIQADRAVAAFVQMGFFEEAHLVRNQSIVQALTWSQATMLSCSKEDLSKEMSQVIIQMINSFIIDYQKAMVPL